MRQGATHNAARGFMGRSASIAVSVPFKIGLTLLEECVQAFQEIMRFEAMPLQANLFIERFFEILTMLAAHAMFHVALRETCPSGDAFRELFGFSFQLIGGNHAADDSQAQGV